MKRFVFSFATVLIAATSGACHAQACDAGQRQGKVIRPGLEQLTGTENQPGQAKTLGELADPAPPYIGNNGQIEIYGTGGYFVRYKNWNDFLSGGCYDTVRVNLRGPNGTNYEDGPWDVRKFRVQTPGQSDQELIIGGTMSATNGRAAPVWPDDNITRRIFFFRPSSPQRWVRDLAPIVGQVSSSWLGHSYGGNLLQVGVPLNTLVSNLKNAIGFFYERVTDDTGNSPFKTELFAQSMDGPDGVLPTQVPILTIGDHPYPSLRRVSGGFLAEGPRPIQVMIQGQTFFIIGFSSGDFPTDNYHINFLWSRQLFGPYTPKLNARGTDLLDLGESFKRLYGLSWVGRPAFFQAPDGSYEMLFHAVEKRMVPDNDYTAWPSKHDLGDFFRNIYKANISLSLDANGEPQIAL